MIRALLFERLGVASHLVSALPGTSVGRDDSVKLKKSRRRLAPHLAVPPSHQSPSPVTVNMIGCLGDHLTRARRGQATPGFIEVGDHGRFAPRSGVTG